MLLMILNPYLQLIQVVHGCRQASLEEARTEASNLLQIKEKLVADLDSQVQSAKALQVQAPLDWCCQPPCMNAHHQEACMQPSNCLDAFSSYDHST